MDIIKRIRLAGLIMLIGMVAGIFSVAPAIDSADYLKEAFRQSNQVIVAAIFQFTLSLTYMGFAILIYPVIKKFSDSLSLGFLSFRILAVSVSIIGTILLLSLLTLSEVFVQNESPNTLDFEALGTILKSTRDTINHIFMVLLLCVGNIMLYILFIKARLMFRWILIWGIGGSILSGIASIFVLFGAIEIITTQYLILNVPTAAFEVFLGIWLMTKGLNRKIIGSL
ncbi:DUF4386 domain-containing protein [Mariniphaga sediminis]|uniref:DUF4386 domain-containing protein n=1 Tax=Mariniphaga sediminis TaxID=1628158 RepID=UPI003565E9C3